MIDSIFLNGTVGVGKTTVAEALGELEAANGRAHAVIDLDQIRRCWPAPDGDPFGHEVELANLRDLVANYRVFGAEHFIVAGVIEDAAEIPRYEAALKSSGLLICRLEADAEVIEGRLTRRHADDPEGLEWHREWAEELAGILVEAALDGLVLDASTRTPRELAATIAAAAGWPATPHESERSALT